MFRTRASGVAFLLAAALAIGCTRTDQPPLNSNAEAALKKTLTAYGRPGKLKARFAADRYAFGEEEYNWAIRNNLRIGQTATQLFEEAWPIVENTRKQMIDVARAIGTSHGWRLPADGASAVRAVFDELSKDYSRSEVYALRSDAAKRLGDTFSPRTLHLLFIRQGTIPPAHFRDTLLNDLPHRSQATQ